MSARFVNLDRQTPMVLPCDLREWIPDDHIVHFILNAVEQLPLAHFHVNHRGAGSEQYPPTMMLALLIYCYELLERARQAETQENQEGLDIPAEPKRRERRKAALQKARRVIETRAKETGGAGWVWRLSMLFGFGG